MFALFAKKIKCKHCGGNFKSKKLRKRRGYLCSRYDNFGECEREVVYEDVLIDLLQGRFGEDMELTRENINKLVDYIEVERRDVFTIKLKDGEPIIFGEKFFQF